MAAGWSFGGVVAFEAAGQLTAAGFHVKGVILIDSPYPRDHQPLPAKVISHILNKAARTSSMKNNNTTLHLQAEFKHNAALLSKYSPPSRSSIKTIMLRSRDTIDTEGLCGVKYDWLSSQEARDSAIRGWEEIAGGGVQVLEIPGNHFEAFAEKHVSFLSHSFLILGLAMPYLKRKLMC